MNACTLDAPPCPAWCLEHVDDRHTGQVVKALRVSLPIESWADAAPEWRAKLNDGAYLAWLLGDEDTLGQPPQRAAPAGERSGLLYVSAND